MKETLETSIPSKLSRIIATICKSLLIIEQKAGSPRLMAAENRSAQNVNSVTGNSVCASVEMALYIARIRKNCSPKNTAYIAAGLREKPRSDA